MCLLYFENFCFMSYNIKQEGIGLPSAKGFHLLSPTLRNTGESKLHEASIVSPREELENTPQRPCPRERCKILEALRLPVFGTCHFHFGSSQKSAGSNRSWCSQNQKDLQACLQEQQGVRTGKTEFHSVTRIWGEGAPSNRMGVAWVKEAREEECNFGVGKEKWAGWSLKGTIILHRPLRCLNSYYSTI